MRHTFGWSLPPGVTQRMLDEQCGDDPDYDAEAEREADEAQARFYDLLFEWENIYYGKPQ